MSHRRPQVLIAGGGIGGLSAALALLQRGFPVDVYEQATKLAEVGAGVQLSPNGTRALHAMGVLDALEQLSCTAEEYLDREWSRAGDYQPLRVAVHLRCPRRRDLMLDRRGFLAALAVGAAARGRGPHPAEPQPQKRETNLARILRTKKLRLAGLIDEEPYFGKDLATRRWNGFCLNMGEDLAAELGAELQIIESNWTDLLIDLQANKFDLCWVSPTVKRALIADFSAPLFHDTFAIVARQEFAPKSWAELNQPQSRIAVDIGSRHQEIVRRVAEDATITGFKTRDEAILAVESGRADCIVLTVPLAVTALKRRPQLGELVVPIPAVQAPVCGALPYDDDHRLRDVINAWGEDTRDSGRMREWIMASLSGLGIGSADLPPGVSF